MGKRKARQAKQRTTPPLLRLPPDVLARIARLVGSNKSRANLKLASRVLHANSQQHPSDWHPSVDLVTYKRLASPEYVASVAAFLQRYQPQLETMDGNMLLALHANLPRRIFRGYVLPCCYGSVKSLNLTSLRRWNGSAPDLALQWRRFVALRDLELPADIPSVLPPGLTSLAADGARQLPRTLRRSTALQSMSVAAVSGYEHLPAQLTRLLIRGVDLRSADLSPLTGLRCLATLEFSNCNLDGLPDMSGLDRLSTLVMWDNSAQQSSQDVVECLPRRLRHLYLRLPGTQALPPGLQELTGLQSLFCQGWDELTGGFNHLPTAALSSLNLSGTGLAELPAELSEATALRLLFVVQCPLCAGFSHLPASLEMLSMSLKHAPGLPRLQHLTALQYLWLGSFKGSPTCQQLPVGITELEFDDCKGLKCIPSGLSRLTALQELAFLNCPIAGGLEHLATLASLTCLKLRGCCFPRLPEALRSMPLHDLWIVGPVSQGLEHVPQSVTHLLLNTRLKVVSLPAAWQQLNALRVLDLTCTIIAAGLEHLPTSLSAVNLMHSIIQGEVPGRRKGLPGPMFNIWP